MKITEITVFQVDLPVEGGDFRQSGGRVWRSLDSTIVRIRTDTGLEGWGETCPFGPNYLPAFAGSARAGVIELAPRLIGADPRNLLEVNRIMNTALYGHPQAKSALDIACWDTLGKVAELPLYQLLGGRFVEDLSGRSGFLTIDLSEATTELMRDYKRQGMVEFEFKASGDPKTDVEMARLIGAEMETGDLLKVDVNQGWQVHEAIRVADDLSDIAVLFEQPCATYEECLSFRRATGRPISLDECILTVRDLLRAVADNAIDVLNLKIGRVGGLTAARQIRDLCATLNIPMYIQETSGTDFAAAVTAHLAHSTPPDCFRSAWDCSEMVTVRTAEGVLRDPSFGLRVPDAPGLGVQPVMEAIGEAVAKFEL